MATIKSRRSATILPQVSGLLTKIHGAQRGSRQGRPGADGDRSAAAAGDGGLPRARRSGRRRLSTTMTRSSLDRQKKLFDAGVTSSDAWTRRSRPTTTPRPTTKLPGLRARCRKRSLGTTVRAPFDGIVGDIPVHLGDYVLPDVERRDPDHSGSDRAILRHTSTFPRSVPAEARIGLEWSLYDTERQAAGEVEDRFSLAAGGSHSSGNPGEGAGSRYARNHAQRATDQGSRLSGRPSRWR